MTVLNPVVVLPRGFDIKAAWDACNEHVNKYLDSRPDYAFAGADPGVVSCLNCGQDYWCWGKVIKCSKCGLVFATNAWSMFAKGVSHRGMQLETSNMYYIQGYTFGGDFNDFKNTHWTDYPVKPDWMTESERELVVVAKKRGLINMPREAELEIFRLLMKADSMLEGS